MIGDILQSAAETLRAEPIKAISDIASALGVLFAAASVAFAAFNYRRNVRSMRANHDNAVADRVTEAFRRYQERYLHIAQKRDLANSSGDEALGRQAYGEYIDLQYNQWQGFLSGAVYPDQYAGMAFYFWRDLVGKRAYGGVNSAEMWNTQGVNTMRLMPRFLAFTESLKRVPEDDQFQRNVEALVNELDKDNGKIRRARSKWAVA